MTNASCADCGRIVAFRTHDPAEIAECRNCGTWVKRTIEMPGVAVRLNKESDSNPESRPRRTAQLPPRKTISPSQPSAPATQRPSDQTNNTSRHRIKGESSEEEMVSASAVYAAIRELQHSVTRLENGQRILLERTLPVSDMPSPGPLPEHSSPRADFARARVEAVPRSSVPQAPSHFYTTRFSSLKVPVIPASLEELGTSKQFSDEELGIAPIPESERTNLTQLIEEPLPEREPLPEAEPEPELCTEPESPQQEEEESPAQTEPSAQPLTASTEIFTLAEAPEAIAEPSPEPEVEATESSPPLVSSPFAYPLKPAVAGGISNPFEAPPEQPAPEETPEETPEDAKPATPFFITSEAEEEPTPPPPATSNLSKQIEAAKSIQSAKPDQPLLEQPSREDLWTEPKRSPAKLVVAILLALLAGLAAFLSLKTDLFSGKASDAGESLPAEVAPPLLELPARGLALPDDDPRVDEARKVAIRFLESESAEDIAPLISPVDPSLLDNFYESLPAASITRLYQGRKLPEERIEIDFLIKDYGRPERLLPLVKEGDNPFLVDWQTFAECEELTLLSLAQGTLILAGEEVDEGAIRSFVQDEGQNGPSIDNENWQAFRLLNLTEEVEAYAVVRKDKPEFQELTAALANTQLKHKGAPAIRAILRVKSIDKEDPETRKPASLEILEVISTTWTDTEVAPENTKATDPKEATASQPEQEQEEEIKKVPAIDQPGEELPPIPAED